MRHSDDGWVEHALERLTTAGYRSGGARRAVVEVLGGQSCALSAVDIEDALRAEGRSVGRASVYRTLEQLDELRLLQRLDVGVGPARYEPAHPSGDHHHHLVCESCGGVTPFEDPELEATIERLSARVRFAVADHDVVLHGVCRTCAG